MAKNIFQKTIIIVALTIFFGAGTNFSQAAAGGVLSDKFSKGGSKKTEVVYLKLTKALEKPLWISIIHSKNQIKRSSIRIRGMAHGVASVMISVNDIYQKTVFLSKKRGKFKTRVNINTGWNEIQVRADNGSENVTATKRVKRI